MNEVDRISGAAATCRDLRHRATEAELPAKESQRSVKAPVD